MVYFKHDHSCCFHCSLLSNVFSCWGGGGDCTLPSILKSRETIREGKNPCDVQWKFTVCRFIRVLLKLVSSLCMSLRLFGTRLIP